MLPLIIQTTNTLYRYTLNYIKGATSIFMKTLANAEKF